MNESFLEFVDRQFGEVVTLFIKNNMDKSNAELLDLLHIIDTPHNPQWIALLYLISYRDEYFLKKNIFDYLKESTGNNNFLKRVHLTRCLLNSSLQYKDLEADIIGSSLFFEQKRFYSALSKLEKLIFK
ncbi:hypothetical protein [Epilithonimonas caeni]|uniref:hypothetical protein n=1 Tax=Epilithonimonas caeni TaxID=365343 RepID=UPI00048602DF|nr:hypothetical protein [Epilithonimonas caeni]